MKPVPTDFFLDLDEQGSSVAMDVDEVDPVDVFGEGIVAIDSKITDSDFFNSFEDDFDDSDIN